MNNELKTISVFASKSPHLSPVPIVQQQNGVSRSSLGAGCGASRAVRAAKLKLKGIRGWSGGPGTNQELIVGYMIVGIVP